MQQSAHNRREDRVPLAAVVSVREARQGRAPTDELEADGLNVSVGGIAVRARFVPPLGTLLQCSFTCPPTGEVVSAQGEVIWSEPHGPGHGQFGMRFVELDTKSATALRRLVHKTGDAPPKVSRPRMARMQIDGLHAGVEAELKLVDETRVVLEQPLTFLQLGRGVDLDVPGRGNERGRIASIELRHGQFDTPKLVFGILLDDAPSKAPVPESNSAWFTGELEEPFPELQAVKAHATAWGKRRSEAPPPLGDDGERISQLGLERTSELCLDEASARSLDLASARFRDPAKLRSSAEEPRPATSREDHIAEARAALGSKSPTSTLQGIGHVGELAEHSDAPSLVPDEHPLSQQVVEVLPLTPPRVRDAEAPRRSSAPLQARDSSIIVEDEPAPVDRRSSVPSDELPDEHTVSEPVHEILDEVEAEEPRGETTPLTLRNLPTHARVLFKKQAEQLAELRAKIEPALREQAESLDLPEARNRVIAFFARLRRFFAALLVRTRRAPDEAPLARKAPRLRLQKSTLSGVSPASEEVPVESPRGTRMIAAAVGLAGVGLAAYVLAPSSPSDEIELPARIANADALASVANAEPPAEEALALELEPPAPAPSKAEKKKAAKLEAPAAELPVFGEAEVPNGRVWELRVDGPIGDLKGRTFENGFTVKVPGRMPVDPAKPIAAAHKQALKRALFMPSSDHKDAELTIEFNTGFAPRYQVRAKDNTLYLTIERL